MKIRVKFFIGSACLAFLALPLTVQAQGVPGGAVHGFHEGNRIAGPVGAVVGTAVGGAVGGVEGILGVDDHYHHYNRRHHHRAHRHYD